MTQSPRHALRVLHDRVQARAEAMETSHGAWPCRAGCDACCRTLTVIPQVSAVEFEALAQAVEELPADIRDQIERRMGALRLDESRPIVCPLLDQSQGRCLVYAARPIACRTYGFYAGRSGDYWCEHVTAHVADRRDTLVAGNQIAMDASCDAQLGPPTDIITLFARRFGGPGRAS